VKESPPSYPRNLHRECCTDLAIPLKSMTGERLDSARISSLDIAVLSRLCGDDLASRSQAACWYDEHGSSYQNAGRA
jgi:hypothetical protein